MPFDRRSVLKATGVAFGGSLFSTTGLAAGRRVDDAFDLDSQELQEALVVLEPGADYGFLEQYRLPKGTYEMNALDIVYTEASGPTLDRIARHSEVQYVQYNHELEYLNGDAQVATKSGVVQDGLGYTGRGVHVAVIDGGLDGYHPDLRARVKYHYQLVNPLGQGPTFVEVPAETDTDDYGHGTHCSGSVLGEGTIDGDHEGMAPDANLTMYSVGAAIAILSTVAPFNHILEEVHPDDPVHITSNSYGATSGQGRDFNPSGGWERATWRAFEAGILTCGSAGNSGPDTNTLGPQKTGPHTLSVAASHDGQGQDIHDTKKPTDFSSRGRTASYEEGEGARWNEFPAEDGGYTAEDRGTGLANLRAFHSTDEEDGEQPERETVNEFEESVTVGPGLDAGAAGGPDTGTSEFIEYTPAEGAANVQAALNWADGAQDVDLFLRADSKDGQVVASSTASQPGPSTAGSGNLEQFTVDVEADRTYFFEVDPWAAAQAQCTLSVVERGPLPGSDDDGPGPLGVYRPGVIAPGHAVVSPNGASGMKPLVESGLLATALTQDPSYVDPQGPAEHGPFYVSISGTSMSCPIVAGICAQVMEAWYTNNGEEYPSPEQVIRIMEGTAEADVEANYTPYNVGAGFVNAKTAVEMAIEGEVPEYDDIRLPDADTGDGEDDDEVPETPDLSADGSRADDGQVFTGGQTNRVEITVSATSAPVTVTDQVPSGWTVEQRFGDVEGVDEGTVDLGRVDPSDVEDDPVTKTYFVEAPSGPSNTGSYDFGPATVELVDGDATVEITGTETNYVIGPST